MGDRGGRGQRLRCCMWIDEMDLEKKSHERKACRDYVAWPLCIIEISLCYYALGAGNELWLEYVLIRCRIYGLM